MVVVGAIILLHSLIPHRHFEFAGEGFNLHAHDCQVNILEDLQLSFSLDHGQGHFEHFIELDQPDLDILLAAEVLLPAIFSDSQVNHLGLETCFVSAPLGFTALRGPPIA